MSQRKKKREQRRPSAVDNEEVSRRNEVLKNVALDSFPIRLPHLLLNAHFHYHFNEGADFTISEHGHWHWEITRIALGAASYSTESYKKDICPGAARYLMIPPKTVHRWHVLKAPLIIQSWQVYIKAEDPEGEQVLKALHRAAIERGFLFAASPEQIQAENILWELAGRPGFSCVMGPVLAGIAGVVLGDLLMRINPWPAGMLEEKPDTETLTAQTAGRLKAFLDQNLCRPITLSNLESHFHFSSRHLNRIFQTVYHCPIGHYLRNQRVELSKCWLGTTGRSIKDIAFSLGYSNPRQFSRYFLEQSGVTPSQYRDQTIALNK
jgi:AraC-like DNA-binding protein